MIIIFVLFFLKKKKKKKKNKIKPKFIIKKHGSVQLCRQKTARISVIKVRRFL